MSDMKYLIKRRQTWYVQVRVPDSLYHAVGEKRKIVRTLGTRDLGEAKARKHAVVGEIKEYLHSLKNNVDIQHTYLEKVIQFKREVDLGLHGNKDEAIESALEAISVEADNYLSPLGKRSRGVRIDSETGYRTDIDESRLDDYRLALKIFKEEGHVLLVSSALEYHIKEESTRLRAQTCNGRVRRVNAFLKWLGGDRELGRVTRQDASRYLTEEVMGLDRSVKTKKDTIGDLSTFFQWCTDRSYCESNPFANLTKTIKDTSRGTKQKTQRKRRAFTSDELVIIFQAIKNHRGVAHPLWPLSLIGLYTGMRGNEIAETRVEDVHEDYIHIPEGKTESSIRDVPIHPLLQPLIKELVKTSKDGYLISDLGRGGEDNKRYHLIGKQFGTLLRGVAGISDRSAVFHCFRKNFATALENANVPLSTASQILGHTKQSLTYGLYSQGVDITNLAVAVNKVGFGKELEKLITG